jgi:DNA-binding transcriptional LysR family regulator
MGIACMYDKGIEAFLAVASRHSISKAAQLLNLSSSAVSHRLRNLEDQLGMILINRQKGIRRSELTLAGERFFAIAERWSQLWRETQHIRANPAALSLIIGCVDSVNTYLMPPLYKALSAHTPPVYLKIYYNRSVELYAKMERRELDVAFVLQEKLHQHIKVSPFFHEPLRIIRLRQRKATSPIVHSADLDPEFELFINWSPPHHIWHDKVWDPLCTAKIELDSVTLVLSLIEDPRHWALIPESVANSFRTNKRLIVQDLYPSPPEPVVFMVTHRFPRIGSRQGIEILESLAHKIGFFNFVDQYPFEKNSANNGEK